MSKSGIGRNDGVDKEENKQTIKRRNTDGKTPRKTPGDVKSDAEEEKGGNEGN